VKKIIFNYSKLKGKITEVCDTKKAFAKKLGISEGSLISKLNSRTYFTQKEILLAIQILSIDLGEVALYFFTV